MNNKALNCNSQINYELKNLKQMNMKVENNKRNKLNMVHTQVIQVQGYDKYWVHDANLNRHALRPSKQYWITCPRKLKSEF